MWRLSRKNPNPDPDPDPRLLHAERRVSDLQDRARRVNRTLTERRTRDYWGETVAGLYRGEST